MDGVPGPLAVIDQRVAHSGPTENTGAEPVGHRGDLQTDEALIANLTEEDDCEGHWIKATVQPDGRAWTITNGRTGYSRNYQSK